MTSSLQLLRTVQRGVQSSASEDVMERLRLLVLEAGPVLPRVLPSGRGQRRRRFHCSPTTSTMARMRK
jgi:hypothetical protein